jgi:hypothetical protein
VSEVREVQVTFDCADPGALGEFWAAALGYHRDPPPPGFDTWDAALEAWGVPPERRNDRNAVSDPTGRGPRLFFQKVPEPKTAKNRVHLDVRVTSRGTAPEQRQAVLEAEAARLVALGATVLDPWRRDELAGDAFVVLSDPEGNELCLS